ncbi:tumor protein p53-inducible nuclear protein 2 isoform X2 [Myripristis murdjan]|uniref:tumor protein p53-inducible nuclear protein 2 isoform X2 n=1 Tax=Myripristis murdjan TaxID=586833 RepID=UPI0011762FAD|nr:uncharacterized protein LOC115358804 isoform X2 [Myripristis murdjan]
MDLGKDSLAAPPAEQRKGRRTEGIGQKHHQYKETLNMFKTITRLLFGGEEETPEDVKPAEVVEEGWLLVNHQEAVSAVSAAEDQDAELADCTPSNPTAHKVDDINQTGSKMSEPEPSVQSSSSSQVIRNSLSQAEALAKVTQVTRVQRAQAWAERHHLSRSAIQRHNCGRQRGQRHHSLTHSTYLHQPGHRNLSH